MGSYKDSLAYQRSQRRHGDGTPVFPLPFARQRSEPLPAGDSLRGEGNGHG
jgi:hypothetical protein